MSWVSRVEIWGWSELCDLTNPQRVMPKSG